MLDYFDHHRIRAGASTPKHPAARFRRYERDHQKTRSVTRGMSAMSTPRGEPRHSSDTGVAGKNDDPLRSAYAPKLVRNRPNSAQPTPASDQRWSTTARRDETLSDLERLEACLLQVQRDEAATRLPRAAQLPPVPGLASVGRRFDGPRPRSRSLEPEHLVPPDAMVLRRNR